MVLTGHTCVRIDIFRRIIIAFQEALQSLRGAGVLLQTQQTSEIKERGFRTPLFIPRFLAGPEHEVTSAPLCLVSESRSVLNPWPKEMAASGRHP